MSTEPRSRALNLGCGRKRRADAVNVDITSDTAPDVVHDLDVRPWPFPDGWFREVYAQDVIEHLDDTVAVMEELHRVCANGAIVHITLPHFSSANAFTDPTHRRFFGVRSFDYFTGEHEHGYYSRAKFKRLARQLVFEPSIVNKVVHRLARWQPARYEHRWAWIFPAWFLSFQLEVVKPSAQGGTAE